MKFQTRYTKIALLIAMALITRRPGVATAMAIPVGSLSAMGAAAAAEDLSAIGAAAAVDEREVATRRRQKANEVISILEQAAGQQAPRLT